MKHGILGNFEITKKESDYFWGKRKLDEKVLASKVKSLELVFNSKNYSVSSQALGREAGKYTLTLKMDSKLITEEKGCFESDRYKTLSKAFRSVRPKIK